MSSVSVEAAVRKRIAELPEVLWTSVDAVLAIKLAEQMDNQVGGASASARIEQLITKLGTTVPEERADSVDDSRSSTAAKLRAVG